MATLPYLLMANTASTNQKQEPTKTHIQAAPPKQETSLTNRGRKPSKGQPRKKIPQRGMGVAQLERLRLQERLKNIQENNKLEPFNLQPAHLPVPDPIQSFPVHYSVNYGAPPVINGGGFLSYDQGLVVEKIENGNSSHLGQFVVNPYMFGAPVGNSSAGPVFENSNELSSMPKIVQDFEHSSPTSEFGFKKKRFSEENNGRRDQQLPEITPANVTEFLGSNLENNMDLNYDPSCYGARATRTAVYANHHNISEKCWQSAEKETQVVEVCLWSMIFSQEEAVLVKASALVSRKWNFLPQKLVQLQ
ncbi:uncharacterized protein LOC8282935 isoform X2 [Ricinus communis]|uniref:uncharacterized protein LOC8282935 isoform X2 n=1 Tax=Ricinus communis TaxID=3988 RepID=UPI00201AECF2|nr:uncharacterized protein LOC8282935 isoform X2 [Ricinus communis]